MEGIEPENTNQVVTTIKRTSICETRQTHRSKCPRSCNTGWSNAFSLTALCNALHPSSPPADAALRGTYNSSDVFHVYK